MKHFSHFCALLALVVPFVATAKHDHGGDRAVDSRGLKDAVVLVIRHAEKPDSGYGLSPAGEERAKTYVNFFHNFTVDSKPVHLDALFAAADSKESHRPRLTLEPLGKALGIPVVTTFANKQVQDMVNELEARHHGRQILICWHHGEIPSLLRALGADPEKLLPNSEWPGHVFGWVIQLHFDHDGHLIPSESKRISEKLMPDDPD